jgi:two-component system response regulator CpxR
VGDGEIALTGTEFDLLQLLAESSGVIVSRDAFARALYGRDTTAYERAIDVHVSHLRKKLVPAADVAIKTVRGAGYVLVGSD